jgi:hypothetical protein
LNSLSDRKFEIKVGSLPTLDHLVRFETFIQNAFAKKEHAVSNFFDLEKAYDTTWKYGILKAQNSRKCSEKIENTKRIIRSRKSKNDRQQNGQDRKTNNGTQNTT